MPEEATPSLPEQGEAPPPSTGAEAVLTSSDADQASHGQENGARTEQTVVSEELVTIPIMKLQQLVEFCAQVLRESRSRETPVPDIESGVQAIRSPDIPLDPTTDAGDYMFTEKDFNDDGLSARFSKKITPESKAEIDEVWKSVESFPVHELLVVKEDHAVASLIESCQTAADLHLLFSDSNSRLSRSATALGELFASNIELCGRSYGRTFDWKLMVAVCAYGAKEYNIGQILQGCYSSGVLDRPANPDYTRYMTDIGTVVVYALIFNRVSRFRGTGLFVTYGGAAWYRKYWEEAGIVQPIFAGHRFKDILGISLPQLLRMLHVACAGVTQEPQDIAAGTTFRADDLNARSLASLGNIRIVWTLVLEDHLLLDLERMTLFVVWQVPFACGTSLMGTWEEIANQGIGKGFCGLSCTGENFPRVSNDEVRKTWAFLFATDSKSEKRKEDYATVDGHQLSPFSKPHSEMKCNEYMRSQHLGKSLDWYFSHEYEMIFDAALSKRLIPYETFPLFETRLRQLRHYMDSQKPRGIRQLWKDKRDTLNYYTFWGVIIFGSLSIFLAFFSLAVSVAQTVASFKALNAS